MRIRPFAFLALTITSVAAAQDAHVPESFRGIWASSSERCGTAHEGSLTITATQVDFYASRGKVMSVRVLGSRDIEVELESRGEGEVWINKRRFVLSEDGRRLTNVMNNHELTRVRCG